MKKGRAGCCRRQPRLGRCLGPFFRPTAPLPPPAGRSMLVAAARLIHRNHSGPAALNLPKGRKLGKRAQWAGHVAWYGSVGRRMSYGSHVDGTSTGQPWAPGWSTTEYYVHTEYGVVVSIDSNVRRADFVSIVATGISNW